MKKNVFIMVLVILLFSTVWVSYASNPTKHLIQFSIVNRRDISWDAAPDQNVNDGEKATEPNLGNKYSNAKWYTVGGQVFDFNTPITYGMRLFYFVERHRSKKQFCEVIFDADGGSPQPSSMLVEVKGGKTIAKPADPKKTGFVFKGWELTIGPEYTDGGSVTGKSYPDFQFGTTVIEFGGTHKFKAVYEKEKVKEYVNLHFESNGGSKVDSQKLLKGSAGTRPVAPTRKGYKFVDWYNEKELKLKYDFSSVLLKDKTVYAKWEKEVKPKEPVIPPSKEEKIKVIFISNGGSKVPNQIINKADKAKRPKDPTREGYRFISWNKEKTLVTVFDFNTKLYKDTYLYAKWRKILPKTGTNNDYIYVLALIFIATGYIISRKKVIK